MYPVLVPVDDDEERAEAQATAVARLPADEGEVVATVLHVTDDVGAEAPAVERAATVLAEAGVQVDREQRGGDPARVILDRAEDVGAELIVLGGRKRSPLGSFLFGSVSQAVLADASRPVTVTGASVTPEPSHVCQDCGEHYYADPATDIRECRSCGGVHVEAVE
jgi:nucleotide-binding universal stress UspA family protein